MYIISDKTLYLEYYFDVTKIVEGERRLEFNGNFLDKILDFSCTYYGSSLKGRLCGSKNILNASYKLPIIVSEMKKLLFFPIKCDDITYWVNFDMIKTYKKSMDGVIIEFKNNFCATMNVSFTVFNNQVLRCSRLWVMHLARA